MTIFSNQGNINNLFIVMCIIIIFYKRGFGKVFPSTRTRDGKKFAMKFFGYTDNKPIMQDINREVLMLRLGIISGVLAIYMLKWG